MRTIVYIDGFNLYYGLKDANLRRCYWLNVQAMAQRLVRPPYQLVATKYFTSRVSGGLKGDAAQKAADREASRLRQHTYLEALGTLQWLSIYEGHYRVKRDYCRTCNADFYRAEEKMTDVRIATELVADAFLNRFDSAIIVSADSDLVPPIKMVGDHFPQKKIIVAFPPCRTSVQLQITAADAIQVWPRTLERCQLPPEIVKPNGIVLRRPIEWT